MHNNNLTEIHDFMMHHVDNIEVMESMMLDQPQVNVPVTKEMFVNGMYAREILIPADTILTGRVHKFGYVDIMLSGLISVATKDGVKKLAGYNLMEGFAGRKRAGYAHEDTRWLTIHRTDHKDPKTIREHLTVMTVNEFKKLLPGQREFPQLPEEVSA